MQLSKPTLGPIVGYTTANQSRIWFRGKFEATGESSYRRCFGVLRYRKKGEGAWSNPLFNKMSPNFDMTCVLRIATLEADTLYEYQVGWLLIDAELEKLSSIADSQLVWPENIYSFQSGTDDGAAARTYAVGSCRYLLKTFLGEIFDDRGDKVFRSILNQHEQARFHGLLMTGDQIYADDLQFVSPDDELVEFLRRYRTVFGQEYIRKLMATVPTYMILDDHEIEDNWPAKATEKDKLTLYPKAIHAYQIYQCSHSPLFDADRQGRIDGTLHKFWYTFSDGCAEWFVMDCRTERCVTNDTRRMVKAEQLTALTDWITDGSSRVKMIVTSVPLAPDVENELDDKWSAFPEQRAQILQAIESVRDARVVFVSGDVHCSYVAQITKPRQTKPVAYQIVSSSFFWPYPHMQRGEFSHGAVLRTVQGGKKFVASFVTDVYSDDNFAKLNITPEHIDVTFFERKGSQLGSPYRIVF
ncbi:MAG: alkaline phosphatase family protein [Nitrosomonas sp.]|nr:MAG: alkaline phosphatase family protein [Nitrosomonas sp.]